MVPVKTRRKRNPEGRMSLGDHLVEFRKRLMIAGIAIVLGMVVGWLLSNQVLNLLRGPIIAIAKTGRNAQLNYGDISGAFDLRLQIAFFIAIIISSPIWLYQIWAFLAPGLTGKEKRWGIAFLGAAVPLFLGGAYAGWIVFPNIVRLLTSFAPSEDAAYVAARTYFDFVLKLMIAMGIGFVMPVFLVLLNFIGVLRGQSILKSWRIAILCIMLFTALATPAADVWSMFLLAVPMVVLYMGAALIAVLHDRRVDKRRAAEFAEYGLDEPNGGTA
ncbi:twin-arginine translocase subunit TatC [Leucobacter iarius]|uniref:Sec-independent protein translocase protein TatC n=2 Tax=Leucobacter iarius TaxID=333963 RepID=A0ABP4XRS5_9MICO